MGPVTAGVVELCISANADEADKKTNTDNMKRMNLFILFPPSFQLTGSCVTLDEVYEDHPYLSMETDEEVSLP
jgi:hypothetical protein